MEKETLAEVYRGYLDCLNRQDWPALGRFVDPEVRYNGARIGLDGYRAMLERDFEQIPDLRFEVDLLVADPPHVASRLLFDCVPVGELFGMAVDGRRVQFSENVFYRLREGRIIEVRSVIDKAAIAAQLRCDPQSG